LTEKDIVIIGGGPGGYVAAIHAAHLGANVALVEKDTLGGTCLNRGRIPTKTLARSVGVLNDAKRSKDFGVIAENISADLPTIVARKRKVVSQLVAGVEQLMKANKISVHMCECCNNQM